MVTVTPIPAFRDNYIWCLQANERAVFVDPGDGQPVLDAVHKYDLHPSAILVTHHHWDHTGGIGDLVAAFDIPVFGPADERIPGCTHPLTEGERFSVPGIDIELTVLEIPGHTLGHIAFTGADMVFCGDTLFSIGCGRLFEGTPAQMWESLQKLRRLPDETRVYCGHEYTEANCAFARTVDPANTTLGRWTEEVRELRGAARVTLPTTLALEKAANPFLRADTRELAVAASRLAGRDLSDPVDVFAALRAAKDAA